MRVCIVDDELHAVQLLEKFVADTPELELEGAFTDPLSALPLLNGKNPPDIAFLDVEMPGLTGLELGQLISGGHVKVVLVTSFNEFGPEAFEINAADYLIKPVSYARFYRCIQKLNQNKENTTQEIKERLLLFVKGGPKENYISIDANDIVYIQAALNYVEIFHGDTKTITYLTLTEIISKLPTISFCRVHRSYIININKIKIIDQAEIEMTDGRIIPIGESFHDSFFNRITPLILTSKRGRGK
ncbi:MAG TPA: LytTR family DNA-binding domain-containing protein [Chitinophagaceae bacterium]